METGAELPIEITRIQRDNPYIISGLAQKAFALRNYDMAPDNAVSEALRLGLIVVKGSEGTLPPTKIKRMPGNGSFA